MRWNPLRDGPHQGKTMPEVFLTDSAYVVRGVEAGVLQGPQLAQAREVCRLAARVRVPADENGEQDVAVFYSLLPDGTYSGHSVVALHDPKLSQYAKHSVARTDNRIDLLMAMRGAPNDPAAPMATIQWLKFVMLGDPNVPLTRQQAEGFFEDSENFLEDE